AGENGVIDLCGIGGLAIRELGGAAHLQFVQRDAVPAVAAGDGDAFAHDEAGVMVLGADIEGGRAGAFDGEAAAYDAREVRLVAIEMRDGRPAPVVEGDIAPD